MAEADTPSDDHVDEYRKYLDRFEAAVGAVDFGTYAKHNGRLIKKLTFDEFEPKWLELEEVNRTYADIVANGDTINDVLVKLMRERCDELLLPRAV
jgi:hypothetical protein